MCDGSGRTSVRDCSEGGQTTKPDSRLLFCSVLLRCGMLDAANLAAEGTDTRPRTRHPVKGTIAQQK